MTFAKAIDTQEARTLNGMKALAGTGDSVVDLFASWGGSRGKDIIPQFSKAFNDESDLAVRTLLWGRDVRGGAGERKLFRDALAWLAGKPQNESLVISLLNKIPELGRWDDLWSIYGLNPKFDEAIEGIIVEGLAKGNGLLAKWLPRQKHVVNGKDLTKHIRERMHLSPRDYRKYLVAHTNVVEHYMCKGNWDGIDFSKIPSLAHSRYRKAFFKHTENYKAYVEALVRGDKSVKVNACAVYPYDVLKPLFNYGYMTALSALSPSERDAITAMWDALPNFLGENSILPLVDTSSSMTVRVAGTTSAMQVAFSLGLYIADKLKGDFHGCLLNFNSDSHIVRTSGSLFDKLLQVANMKWGGSTNLHSAFNSILETAINGNVAPEDMPKTLLIFSDMQFNYCVSYDDSAMEMIRRKYEEAGYEVPQIVFWSLVEYGNRPVKANEEGVALVSGFSPSIVRSVLSAKTFTPRDIMLETLMQERYNYQ